MFIPFLAYCFCIFTFCAMAIPILSTHYGVKKWVGGCLYPMLDVIQSHNSFMCGTRLETGTHLGWP